LTRYRIEGGEKILRALRVYVYAVALNDSGQPKEALKVRSVR
jgi:hypothetical protein